MMNPNTRKLLETQHTGSTVIRPFGLLIAQIKCNIYALWTFQRTLTFTQYRSFPYLGWFPLVHHTIFLATEDGQMFWATPHLQRHEVFEIMEACRELLEKQRTVNTQ